MLVLYMNDLIHASCLSCVSKICHWSSFTGKQFDIQDLVLLMSPGSSFIVLSTISFNDNYVTLFLEPSISSASLWTYPMVHCYSNLSLCLSTANWDNCCWMYCNQMKEWHNSILNKSLVSSFGPYSLACTY